MLENRTFRKDYLKSIKKDLKIWLMQFQWKWVHLLIGQLMLKLLSGQSHLEDFILRLKDFNFEEHFDSKSNNHISYEPIGVLWIDYSMELAN